MERIGISLKGIINWVCLYFASCCVFKLVSDMLYSFKTKENYRFKV